MKKPIHILQIIDGLELGGAEVLLYDLITRLPPDEFRVSVCYFEPGPLEDDFFKLGIPVARFPWSRPVDPALMLRLSGLMRSDPPQIVHTHLFKSDFNGRLAARLSGVPSVVTTLHSCNDWARTFRGWLYGINSHLADKIIAVSDEVYDFALRYMHTPKSKTVSIPNGIPVDRFKKNQSAREAFRSEFNISADAPLIGIVAALVPVKDHMSFLEAARRIHQTAPQARFVIVGDGPLRAALTDKAAELGLGETVIFCGNRRDIPAVMSALDVLVFSSTVEGLPVALLEGMAASCPVVATTAGGMRGVVVDNETGILVPPSKPDALADACLRLVSNPQLARQMGQAGYERAESRYSIDAMMKQTIDLYRQLSARRGATPHE